MTALTFANARVILQSRIADSSDDTAVDQALNSAQREVARARRWPELIVRDFFNTEAAYDTGKVAVTESSATVTGTGTSWPATVASALHRFALSTTSPWYEVKTRTSDTIIVLQDVYIDDTDTSTDYIAYRSHYSLAATADRVEEMWLHRPSESVKLKNAATDNQVTEFLHFPSGPGVPTHYYSMERDASGYRQVLLGPNTPDDVYRVEYTYKKDVTDGTLGLDDARWPVVLQLAVAILYEPEFFERSQVAYARYEKLLDREWARESEAATQNVRVGQNRVNFPSDRNYMESFPHFGVVE